MKKFLSGKVVIGAICFLLLAGSVYIAEAGIPKWIIDTAYCAGVKCNLYNHDAALFSACMDGCLYSQNN